MSLHIGIVACSAEGASLCYRTLCSEAPRRLGPHVHPEISLHGHSLADYARALDEGDLQAVADLMLSSSEKLAAAGADFLICPDNTIHQALHLVEPASPLPWLHIAEVVAEAALAKGLKRLGITGTAWLVESQVYPDRLSRHGLEAVKPEAEDRQLMQQVIMDELVYGDFRPASVAAFQGIVERLKAKGCDGVVLGCTEIPLILSDENAALPTLDSTRLLARAALARAVSG